jgi:hypothetical protein
MTIALLQAKFRSLTTSRKRLQLKKIKDGASKNIDWRARCTSANAVGGEIEMWLVCDKSRNFKQPGLSSGLHVTTRSKEKT